MCTCRQSDREWRDRDCTSLFHLPLALDRVVQRSIGSHSMSAKTCSHGCQLPSRVAVAGGCEAAVAAEHLLTDAIKLIQRRFGGGLSIVELRSRRLRCCTSVQDWVQMPRWVLTSRCSVVKSYGCWLPRHSRMRTSVSSSIQTTSIRWRKSIMDKSTWHKSMGSRLQMQSDWH